VASFKDGHQPFSLSTPFLPSRYIATMPIPAFSSWVLWEGLLFKNKVVYSSKDDIKGQLHEIFDPRFFSSINPTCGPDSRPKVISRMASYLPRKSIIFEKGLVKSV
jgi:hypothetical protein